MSVTPERLNFQYTIDGLAPPAQQGTAVKRSYHDFVSTKEKPNWIRINVNNTTGVVTYNVSTYYAKQLSIGTHQETIKFYGVFEGDFYETRPDGEDIRGEEEEFIGAIVISLEVLAGVYTEVDKTELVFNHEIGSALPIGQSIAISSNKAWTAQKNDSWLLLDPESGSNDGTIEVNVNTSSLAAGTYSDTISVSDGSVTRLVNVTLFITEIDSGTFALYVSVYSLLFDYRRSGPVPQSQSISLSASHPWVVSANEPWVVLGRQSGPAGDGLISIDVQNLDDLILGTHHATITVQMNSVIREITVSLLIREFLDDNSTPDPQNPDQPIVLDDKIYFTRDNNLVKIGSTENDTFLQVEVSSNYNNQFYKATYSAPFNRGEAQKRIGALPGKLLEDVPLQNHNEFQLFVPYALPVLVLTVKEQKLFDDTTVKEISAKALKFVKGHKPPGKFITTTPETIHVSAEGTVAIHFLHKNTANKVILTGAISLIKTFAAEESEIYSLNIPLPKLGNFLPGDQINLSVDGLNQKIIVLPPGTDQTLVWFQNEWGLWDVFEFRGEFREEEGITKAHDDVQKDYEKSEKKSLSSKDETYYTLNTGWVYSNKEIIMLKKLLNALNYFIVREGKLIPCICVTKKLKTEKTDELLKSHDVKFEKTHDDIVQNEEYILASDPSIPVATTTTTTIAPPTTTTTTIAPPTTATTTQVEGKRYQATVVWTGGVSLEDACSFEFILEVIHYGSSDAPQVGDILYYDVNSQIRGISSDGYSYIRLDNGHVYRYLNDSNKIDAILENYCQTTTTTTIYTTTMSTFGTTTTENPCRKYKIVV